jgi:hypothetical protein
LTFRAQLQAPFFAFNPAELLQASPPQIVISCYHESTSMPASKQPARNLPMELAQRVTEALSQERFVQRFADSYVVEHGRYALQTHAPRYRELLALLTREALLGVTLCVLEQAASGAGSKKQKSASRGKIQPQTFRREFLRGLARQRNWSAGDALEFQSELRVYEELRGRSATKRPGKSAAAADHPFVDRCAILLDPSFIEQARVAAGHALRELEILGVTLYEQVFGNSPR